MEKNIFKYSQGAQVKGSKSIVFFLLSIAFIVVLIVLFARGHITPALILVPIITFCIVLAADVRGLEIDHKQNLYRQYRIHQWSTSTE